MKNPLIIFSELLGSQTVLTSLTEAATLEFCYDHVTEDLQEASQDAAQTLQQVDFPALGIQETE